MLLAHIVPVARAHTCPNSCSGRGTCEPASGGALTLDGSAGVCSCFSGYRGPDCSKRTCLKERHSGTRLLPIALLTVMVSNALVLVHVTRRLASVYAIQLAKVMMDTSSMLVRSESNPFGNVS